MSANELIAFGIQSVKRNLIASVILCVGLVLVIIGSLGWFSRNQTTVASSIPLDAATSIEPTRVITPTKMPGITVDIEGAVNKPGVYNLPADSRIENLLTLAQGLSSNADTTKVAQTINLSAKLVDSMKVYIPAIGDTDDVVLGASTGGESSQVNGGGAVNINAASLSDLDALPGIGPVTAQKIIDNRPYASVSDLQTKKIVKSNVYTEIKDKVVAE